MPNHVTNVLAIRGDRKHVAELLERIKNDKNGLGSVDFNKIITMPAELSITAGSKTDSGLRKYREYISESETAQTQLFEQRKFILLSAV